MSSHRFQPLKQEAQKHFEERWQTFILDTAWETKELHEGCANARERYEITANLRADLHELMQAEGAEYFNRQTGNSPEEKQKVFLGFCATLTEASLEPDQILKLNHELKGITPEHYSAPSRVMQLVEDREPSRPSTILEFGHHPSPDGGLQTARYTNLRSSAAEHEAGQEKGNDHEREL